MEDDFSVFREGEPIVRELMVTKVADGLGFGDGKISVQDRLNSVSEDNRLEPELLQAIEQKIDSDEILIPIDANDDGCSDGRGVARIFRGLMELKRSLNRAKVLGGGETMTAAAEIGLGHTIGKQFGEVFKGARNKLNKFKIPFGAHTDKHAKDKNGGCGAIDEAPQIVSNTIKFEDNIKGAINVLSEGTHNEGALKEVFNNYRSYTRETNSEEYSGRQVLEEIMEDNKVVKELGGKHLEVAIVINTVRGKTVNQEVIRQISGGKAQVFAIDEWRLRDLSEKLYDDPGEQQKAYLSMLVYTLSTTGTLTKGDLPVFVVKESKQLVAA